MNPIYEKLIEGHAKYGTTREKVASYLRVDPNLIKKNVVIAPTMTYDCFNEYNPIVTELYSKYHSITNLKIDDVEFTFITTGMGAPIFTDIVLGLGVTPCENILFIGSVGALNEKINIGDIIIPNCSITGDGISKYLTMDNLKQANTFGEKTYPNKELYDLCCDVSKKICEKNNVSWHSLQNFSIDTIFAQFAYIEEIKNMGCDTIEMETSALFRASEIAELKACSIFTVSDNTIKNKSLYSGIKQKDKEAKHYGRYKLTPLIILEILKKLMLD